MRRTFFNGLDAEVRLGDKLVCHFGTTACACDHSSVVLADRRQREILNEDGLADASRVRQHGGPAVQLDDLAARLEQLEDTRSRLKMYDVLGTLIKETPPEEISTIAYLCEGRLLPAYTGVEIGVGERLVTSAIAIAFDRTSREIQRLFKRTGDLGNVAERLVRKKTSDLTVTQTYRSLLSIAQISGVDSIDRKTAAAFRRVLIPTDFSPVANRAISLGMGSCHLGASSTVWLVRSILFRQAP